MTTSGGVCNRNRFFFSAFTHKNAEEALGKSISQGVAESLSAHTHSSIPHSVYSCRYNGWTLRQLPLKKKITSAYMLKCKTHTWLHNLSVLTISYCQSLMCISKAHVTFLISIMTNSASEATKQLPTLGSVVMYDATPQTQTTIKKKQQWKLTTQKPRPIQSLKPPTVNDFRLGRISAVHACRWVGDGESWCGCGPCGPSRPIRDGGSLWLSPTLTEIHPEEETET